MGIFKYLNERKAMRHFATAGHALLLQGNLSLALENCNKAIELDPEYYEAYIFRGDYYCIETNYIKAEQDFAKAISIRPNTKEAYYKRGIVYYCTMKIEKAISDFRKVLEIDPNDDNAKFYMNRIDSKNFGYRPEYPR